LDTWSWPVEAFWNPLSSSTRDARQRWHPPARTGLGLLRYWPIVAAVLLGSAVARAANAMFPIIAEDRPGHELSRLGLVLSGGVGSLGDALMA
jgi:hypothetical protein